TSFRTARENFTSVCLTMSCEGSLNTCTWQVNDRKRCDDASHSKALRAKSLPDAFLFREALGVRTRPRVAFSYFESRLLLAATATSLMRGRKNSCWHGELVGSRVCRALVSEEDAGCRTPRLVRTALRFGRSELDVLFCA